jgi:hypothetical protein
MARRVRPVSLPSTNRASRRRNARSDPAAQWTGALKGPAFFAYVTNYLIDTENAVILDVKAARAIRQAEGGASRTMLERVEERLG